MMTQIWVNKIGFASHGMMRSKLMIFNPKIYTNLASLNKRSWYSLKAICWLWNKICLNQSASDIWVRSQNCGCLVTWFCYQLIAKPGNKTATVSWPDPYIQYQISKWPGGATHLGSAGKVLKKSALNIRWSAAEMKCNAGVWASFTTQCS